MPGEAAVPPECAAADVEVELTWQERDGHLRGWVTVHNTGGQACRVTGKPRVVPLGPDGSPLPVETVVTLELRTPDHVVIEPGEQARAPVSWAGWDGEPAGDEALVEWGHPRRSTRAPVTGPRQPASATGPTNLSSGWFRTIQGR